jgi:hypothetical protein
MVTLPVTNFFIYSLTVPKIGILDQVTGRGGEGEERREPIRTHLDGLISEV